MPAYLIADIRIINQQRYDEYRLLVRDVISGHGGRYVVRSSDIRLIEGGWAPQRLVVIEFPTRDAALSFHASAEYQAARDMRTNATMMDLVLVDGITSATPVDSANPRVYAIADTRVINRSRFDEYLVALHEAVANAGGRDLVWSEIAQVLEGGWEPQLLWVAEFGGAAAATQAYQSLQHRHVRDMVINSSMVDMVLVEGLSANDAPDSTFL